MLMENRNDKQALVPRRIPEPYPTLPMFDKYRQSISFISLNHNLRRSVSVQNSKINLKCGCERIEMELNIVGKF